MKKVRAARAAMILGCVAPAGCSAPSEIMIAVQTDLSLPKDIDTIELQVRRGTETKFQNFFQNLGEADAQARLPLTLGAYTEDEPGAEVRVRAIGRTGGQQGPVRILREVETTLPEERVALLHVPLHFLCDGSGVQQGFEVENTECPDGQTCVAGACTTIAVDSSALPDYAPGDVFGGGSGTGDGDCFDVAGCFAGATAVMVEAGACAFSANGAVNVALRTGGDGIETDAGPLVALDAGTAEGFRQSGQQVLLPPAVCTQRMAGKVVDVVTAPASGSCPQKTIGLPTCGPWSAAGGK
jgi:hypothetical protein